MSKLIINDSEHQAVQDNAPLSFSKTISRVLKAKSRQVGPIVPFTPEKQYTEPEFLEAFQNGESEALRAIYLAHYPATESYVLKNSGNVEEAKDLFQDVLLVVYQKLTSPGFVLTCQIGNYIYSISRRMWQKKLRDERPVALHTTGAVDGLEQENLDLLIRRMQRYKLYEDKFAELGENCQKLLKLFLTGKSTQEVMEHFGFGSISYTKKRKCQCKAKLIKLIMEDPAYKELTDND